MKRKVGSAVGNKNYDNKICVAEIFKKARTKQSNKREKSLISNKEEIRKRKSRRNIFVAEKVVVVMEKSVRASGTIIVTNNNIVE
ncbi:9037_t:CDS:2, partial [Ambispora gerdemannii]